MLKSYHASAHMPAWRNGPARWSSNPKVVGSTPGLGPILLYPGKVGILTGNLFSLGLSYIKWENILRPALIF